MAKKLSAPLVVPLYPVKVRRLTLEQRRNVIWLRYGSLTDFSRPKMPLKEVARHLNVR